jgi:hypothetical protein
VLRVAHEVFDNDDMDRPLLNEVTEMAENGEFDLLVADKVDRFSRADPRETDYYIMSLERLGVKTVLLDMDQTGDPDIDDILFFFKKWKAKREKKDTTERTQRGRMRRLTGQGRHLGILVGPHPRYGYVWDDPQQRHRYAYVRDPESAQWVEWIYQRAADGWDSAKIARELTALGVPTPRQYYQAKGLASQLLQVSLVWQPRLVRNMIWNDGYIGRHWAFQTQWARHTGRRIRDPQTGKSRPAKYCIPRAVDDPKRLEQKGLCEPLVSVELAEAARSTLIQYRDAHSYRRQNPTTATGEPLPPRLLAGGFIICGHCGGRLIGVSSGKRKYYERRYHCGQHRMFLEGVRDKDCPGGSVSITGDALDLTVWYLVVQLLTDGKTLPDAIAKLRARADMRNQARATRRNSLREAMERAEETIAVNNRLMQASARQDVKFTETRQFAMWRLEVQEAEEAIANYEKQVATLDADDEPMERHLQLLDRMAQREHNEAVATLLSLDFEGRRQMLREMGLHVVVWNTAHSPRWGIRIGPPDTPLVVTAQEAPAYNVSQGIEYQHYIWHEIAGLVDKLLVSYGADAPAEDSRSESGADVDASDGAPTRERKQD